MACVLGKKIDFLNFFLDFPKENMVLWDRNRLRFETENKIYQYYFSAESMRGIHGAEVVWVTSAYNLPDGEELLRMAAMVQVP